MEIEQMTILRHSSGQWQTLGNGFIQDRAMNSVFEFHTLELPWKNNQKRVSCIPPGIYTVVKHVSPRFGPCLWVKDVPGRSEILIHKGNYYRDTLGCILPGKSSQDINADGKLDVTSSSQTMRKILELVPDTFKLLIRNV